MRRFAGSRRVRATSTAYDLDAAIIDLSPYSFVESDYYAVDGVSGKISSLLDKVPAGTGIKAIDATHAYAQATSANQASTPASSALFAGKPTLDLSGNSYYDSSAAASAWKCLHDGTGSTVVIVAAANTPDASGTGNCFASTMDLDNASGTETGAACRYGAQTGRVAYVVRKSGSAVINTSFATAGWVNDSPRWVRFRYQEAVSPEYNVLDKGTTIASGNSSVAPSTGNPTQTLRLFSDYSPATYGLKARWVSTMIWNRLLTTEEVSAVQAYILAKYGLS